MVVAIAFLPKKSSAQKEQQWPATVCIGITHTEDGLDATTGATLHLLREQHYKGADLLDVAH